MSNQEKIRQLVDSLKEKYPEAKLSFGYIGNCDMGLHMKWDDRNWYVFTDVYDKGSKFKWPYFGYGTDYLGTMLSDAEEKLEDWIVDKVMKRVIQNKEDNESWNN